MTAAPALRLRPATRADAGALLAWRNDPLAVAMSLSGQPVLPQEHIAWLERALTDTARQILIIEADGAPLGMVRFDLQGDAALVSIALSPDARGRGLARPALAQAIAALTLPARRLLAQIRPGNAASLALFAAMGFEPLGGTDPLDFQLRLKSMTEKTKHDLIIDEIEAVRTRNNKNWMDILRLAFRHSPDEAAAILREIYKEDKAISDLAARLTE